MAYNRSVFPEGGYDVFKENYDLSPSLKPLALEYQNLKSKATLTPTEVQRLNELMTILEDFLITPEKINYFQDAVSSTQKFFVENTVGYIEEKQTEFQAEIDKFNNMGTFNITTQYYKNNFVDFDDGAGNQTYICLQNCVGKSPSSNPLFWKKLTIQGKKGDKGDSGANFKFVGTWSDTKTYIKDDAVNYGGILFVSRVDNNLGQMPDIATDTAYWYKAMEIAISVKNLIGTRTVVSQTNTVNFMVGDITSFNSAIDGIDVYMNSVRLTKGIDYEINPNNMSIDKKNGIWDGTVEPIFFEFSVLKNVLNNLIFKDGTALQDGTVLRTKLDVETQGILANVNSFNRNILMTIVGNSEKVEFPSNGNIVTTTYDSSMQVLKTSTVIFNVDGGILEVIQFSDGTYYKLLTTFGGDGSVNTVVQDN